ncbi:hypothetical protein DBB36_19335 [Flavobacterium sp. WLB]|uniref:DUF6602 domain-containing protein n=1 Tax=unclassified Flavobacterium TaxID=196869 RepID=UPI0006ABDDD4|nr:MULTISPECIES: DUF6602 domain-containing protein [unclassified Flavobacterium]KOP36109.1 hypothetical protein AKO67_22145 [Flavobacterium sp. VMW]OWU89331.1 hypothetical protein APR43_19250 [Flavobacterium sp. NLM]PUU68357.1 hypothetical protein DBB36_19335 [Flavobacterium sp. WLB]
MMNTIEFHKSTTKELLAIKDRVRNLITHWGEDGRYQEAVIKTVIQRFLPEKFKIGTGFVVRQTGIRGEHEASKQIDLIIYDTSCPILFKENDFVILTPDSILGIIEVKANATNQGLQQIVKKSNENGKFIFDAKTDKSKPIFNGIFSYDSTVNNVDTIATSIKLPWDEINQDPNKHKFCVNHISLNQNWFYKFWEQEFNELRDSHFIYKIEELSFSFFISNLMDWIGGRSVLENSNLWFPVGKSIQVKKKFR